MAAKSRRSVCTGKMIFVFLTFLISITDAKPQYIYPATHQHSVKPLHGYSHTAGTRTVRANQPINAYASPVTHSRHYRDDKQQLTQLTYENTPSLRQDNAVLAAQPVQQPLQSYLSLQPAAGYETHTADGHIYTDSVTQVRTAEGTVVEAEGEPVEDVESAVKKADISEAEDDTSTYYTCCIPVGRCIFHKPKGCDAKCECGPFWPPYSEGPWMPYSECGPYGYGHMCPLDYPPPMCKSKGKNCNFDCGNCYNFDYMPCLEETQPCNTTCKDYNNFGWDCPYGCDDNSCEAGIAFICKKCKAEDCFKHHDCRHFGHHGGPHHHFNPCIFDMMFDCPYY